MRFQTPLVPARLQRRYKRFLADAVLEQSGEQVVAHCPNPGSMLGLAEPGQRIWLEPNSDPRRKLAYGWRLVELRNGGFACIDTGVANRVVREALERRAIAPLSAFERVRAEVRFGERSRVDFVLSGAQAGAGDLYLEVKSVTLAREAGRAEFPDAVTARGTRHLAELGRMVEAGHRAAMLYLVQRTDCHRLSLARDIDPTYGKAFDAARAKGVEMLVFGTRIAAAGVELSGPLVLDA